MSNASILATVTKLLNKHGRDIDLIALDKTPIDADRPWKGKVDNDTIVTVKAVILTPNAVRIFGLSALGDAAKWEDMMKYSEKVIVMGPVPTGHVITDFAFVDDGERYKIDATQRFQPGEVEFLNYLGVSR